MSKKIKIIGLLNDKKYFLLIKLKNSIINPKKADSNKEKNCKGTKGVKEKVSSEKTIIRDAINTLKFNFCIFKFKTYIFHQRN